MLLNADKSNAILVSQHKNFFMANTCLVAGTIVPIKNTLTALGAVLDSRLSGTAFVTSKVQSCKYHLRALLHLRLVLGHKLGLTVARAIGLSELDYCNGILTGIS